MTGYTKREDISKMQFLEKCDLPVEILGEYWEGKPIELKIFLKAAEEKFIYTIGDLIERTEDQIKDLGNFRTQMSIIRTVEEIGLRFGSGFIMQKARKDLVREGKVAGV